MQKPIFIQEQKIVYNDSYVIKIEWINDQKILIVLTNKQIYFYFINNLNNFDYTHIKEIKFKKDLKIDFEENGSDIFDELNMVYNAYNSTLIITFLTYNNENFKSFIQICVFDIKSLTIIKKLDIQIYDEIYEKYYLHLLDKFTIIITFVTGFILAISLKEQQLITFIQALNESEIDEDSELKINIGYSQFYQIFQDKYYFKIKIKIVNK